MGASLSKMWRDFEKEKPLGCRSVFVQVGLEVKSFPRNAGDEWYCSARKRQSKAIP